MKKRIQDQIKKLKETIKELEKEWDRLDSTGQNHKQQQIADQMVEEAKKIEDLEGLLKFLTED